MKKNDIKWDELPETLSKEQLYKLCHISKETARYLLMSGLLPCKCSGKKTRCYQVAKADVQDYLKMREKHPEIYAAPSGYYMSLGSRPNPRPLLSEKLQTIMREYYEDLLAQYDDVLSSKQVAEIVGYEIFTVNRWCHNALLQSFFWKNRNMIPKTFLLDFLCSPYCYAIVRKSPWHIRTLMQISRIYQWKTKQEMIAPQMSDF